MTDAPIPLVVLFGIVATLLVRSHDVKTWQATVIGLFGFYLASTPAADTVSTVVDWLLGGFLHQ